MSRWTSHRSSRRSARGAGIFCSSRDITATSGSISNAVRASGGDRSPRSGARGSPPTLPHRRRVRSVQRGRPGRAPGRDRARLRFHLRGTLPESGARRNVPDRLPASGGATPARAREACGDHQRPSSARGSAVRGACADLERLGAQVVAVGALAVLGTPFVTFARERALALEALAHLPHNVWAPSECPLCERGVQSKWSGRRDRIDSSGRRHTLPTSPGILSVF